MNYILFDDFAWQNLLPLTFTKPVSEIRIGILTITEKWKSLLSGNFSYQTQGFLSEKYSSKFTSDTIFINGKICPTNELIKVINSLPINAGIKKGNPWM